MFRRLLCVVAALLLSFNSSQAQNKNKTDEVCLFQTFFQDAPIAASPYGEGFFQFANFDRDLSLVDFAAQAAFPVAPKMQIGGALAFERKSYGNAGSQSGLTDLQIAGRYNVVPGATPITIGVLLTLPIGNEDIGEGTFDFSGFGSLRHSLPSGLVLTGTLGLFEHVEQASADHEAGWLIAGGMIAPMTGGLNLIGELKIHTRNDFTFLTGGVDYELRQAGGRLRGMVGLGLDDGAPNFLLRGGYFLVF